MTDRQQSTMTRRRRMVIGRYQTAKRQTRSLLETSAGEDSSRAEVHLSRGILLHPVNTYHESDGMQGRSDQEEQGRAIFEHPLGRMSERCESR